MSNKTYGKFNEQPGSYTMTELPEAGNYEYIFKNDSLLLKVDQFGLVTAQVDAPSGEAVFKREERELFSPVRIHFCAEDGMMYNNFDVYRADKMNITFTPESATYSLRFGETEVITHMFVVADGCRFVMNVRIVNHSASDKKYSVMPCVFPYLNEFSMAPWDKPEWYSETDYMQSENAFLTTKFSVAGRAEERRFLTILSDLSAEKRELSLERLVYATKNYTAIPKSFSGKTGNELYAFKQCVATINQVTVNANDVKEFTLCFAVAKSQAEVGADIAASREYLHAGARMREIEILKEKYERLFSLRRVKTNDGEFDKFVNGFLPLEMYWVSSLDRGWPTGMRGVRDAANDFEGMLCYDAPLCGRVIENIFSKQRSDGWYPRQVPFGGGSKFDLRQFVDSACFFTEFVYDYIAQTDDYKILDKTYGYYDSDLIESGLTHLKKGVDYLLQDESLGEHGLVRMRGGDWLDCLGGAGIKGIGETVMVTCQLVMSIEYLCRILEKLGKSEGVADYRIKAQNLKDAINESAYNGSFYNAVYTDGGRWLLSDCDEDGVKRVYVPTNAYAVISGVADGKQAGIFKEIKALKTSDGYKLFSYPLGERYIEGIGKMGTGDFRPYFAENGSVYNHGSQCFLIRALAVDGRYDEIDDVLGYAMPIYPDKHSPERLCSAPYAVTNCYHLVPSFYGRAGFSFLTGSVAMIQRAVYSWVFGVNFTLDSLTISPCIPEKYADAQVKTSYADCTITINYHGYGAKIRSASINGKSISISADGRSISISKSLLCSDCIIEVELLQD